MRQGINQECFSIPLSFACLAAKKGKKKTPNIPSIPQETYLSYSCSQSPPAHGHGGFGVSSWGGALTQNVFGVIHKCEFGVISKDGVLPIPQEQIPKGLLLPAPQALPTAHREGILCTLIWRDFLQWQIHLVHFQIQHPPLYEIKQNQYFPKALGAHWVFLPPAVLLQNSRSLFLSPQGIFSGKEQTAGVAEMGQEMRGANAALSSGQPQGWPQPVSHVWAIP